MGPHRGPLRQSDLRGLPSVTLKPAVSVHRRIAEIGREAWDACAAHYGNPFVRYDFLDALEETGCAVERQGWGPQHLAVEDEAGRIAAVMPLYLKSHSQGEYVFDHAWADAYERAGGRYYPKLLCAAPFTPATGPRLLLRPDTPADEGRGHLLGGAASLCERYDASSFHINFPTEDEWLWLGEQGVGLRQGQQYHWRNPGYASFEDFLAALSSGRRKTIRRERREAQAGLEILRLTGADLCEDHWDAFFGFYLDTGSRKWGRPYLTRAFFSELGARMADQVLLVMARREGRWIAGALNL
ncbi:MAG: GNAT family N-acetyltransferase, partial [Caulobacteraceae bacterium]|nr:GNAT family N-acetyltransferase [Caulobacteraceae bacterium]